MGWAGDKTAQWAREERGPRQAQVLYARTAYLCTVPRYYGSESSPRWRAGRPGRPGEEVSGRAGVGVVAEIAGGLGVGGWMGSG